MRKLLVVLAVVALATPLVLLAQEGGVEANGWEARLDRGDDPSGVLNFMSMGDGVHATTAGRGAAIFWRTGDTASGNYTISASFTQMEPSDHPNAYGLFFGGSNLSADNQQYSYFVIREDGQFLIKKRAGSDTPDVVDWTPNGAVTQLDSNGRSTNVLSVEVGASQVRFLVNGTEVSSQSRSAVDTSGLTGLRVNHQLNVHIGDLDLGS